MNIVSLRIELTENQSKEVAQNMNLNNLLEITATRLILERKNQKLAMEILDSIKEGV